MATTTALPKTRNPRRSFLLESRRTEEVFTPEDFNEQQQLIGKRRKNLPQRNPAQAEKMEHKDFSISRALIKKAGELGLAGVEVPEAYGGLEMDKSPPPSSPTTLRSTPACHHLGRAQRHRTCRWSTSARRAETKILAASGCR